MRVRRVTTTSAFALFWLLMWTGPASAHGFGQRYDLPVPLWLYLYGAGSAVLLSFVVFGFFVGERNAPGGYLRLNLLRFGVFRATFASRAFVSGLRFVSVALFLLVVDGLFGDQASQLNFVPSARFTVVELQDGSQHV